jgi:HlyD family secretion protein
VDIGAQVAGTIQELSPGIDYASIVKRGQILAQVDPALYKLEVAKAQANLKRAEANLKLTKTKADLAARECERVKKRVEEKRADSFDLEVAKAALDAAKDEIPVDEAIVAQAKVALEGAAVNLDYTKIRSPIDGVIIDRRCTVGQSLRADLNAPSLFLVAKDLKKMELWVLVPEVDIPKIAVGQAVTYSVDAYPKESFTGTVKQIRLNATADPKGAVTYTVTVATDNSNGKLLPYLTAKVTIDVSDK